MWCSSWFRVVFPVTVRVLCCLPSSFYCIARLGNGRTNPVTGKISRCHVRSGVNTRSGGFREGRRKKDWPTLSFDSPERYHRSSWRPQNCIIGAQRCFRADLQVCRRESTLPRGWGLIRCIQPSGNRIGKDAVPPRNVPQRDKRSAFRDSSARIQALFTELACPGISADFARIRPGTPACRSIACHAGCRR